jgi:ubiquitin C-terminal hydrolase
MHCWLAGLIVHSESATEGHYVAYINQNGQWRLYGDARVQKVAPAAEQAAESAYYIFTAGFLNTLSICPRHAFS